MTNADKIREMTDEELAAALMTLAESGLDASMYPCRGNCLYLDEKGWECRDCILKWLGEDAE